MKKQNKIIIGFVVILILVIILYSNIKPLGLIDIHIYSGSSQIVSQSQEKTVFKLIFSSVQDETPPRDPGDSTCTFRGSLEGSSSSYGSAFVYASCSDSTCGSGITEYKIPQEALTQNLVLVSGNIGGLTINPLSGKCRISTETGKRPSTPDLYATLICENLDGRIQNCPEYSPGTPSKGSLSSPEGYLIIEYQKVQPIICSEGQEKCEGTINSLCSNNQWVSQGQVVGKCGFIDSGSSSSSSSGGGIDSSKNYSSILIIIIILIGIISLLIALWRYVKK